jgi:hypothetical protein
MDKQKEIVGSDMSALAAMRRHGFGHFDYYAAG